MDIKDFVSQYDLKQIIELESQDPQFCALWDAWQQIKDLPQNTENLASNFLFFVIQNALISYQLSGRWENRRAEFSSLMVKHFKEIKTLTIVSNFDFWCEVLWTCKNNSRLNKIKLDRIQKTLKYFEILNNYQTLKNFYSDMVWLNNFLAQMMDQKKDAKTITFAVKMFGYWARIVFGEIISYPFDINIPIDSRLIKIYQQNTWKIIIKNKEIQDFFANLSLKYKIPPLHLDTILRLKYRDTFISKPKKWII